ncbi:MAG: PaaI family thioesterase [Alphaproteobacteria bacterium]|nr:PaaI family thioesterase [Alphaproteobacteria bacterium]
MADRPTNSPGNGPDEGPTSPTKAAFSAPIPHVAELGIELVEAVGGRGLMRLPWRSDLVGNPETGVLHGGVVTTLIDSVCGLACLTALEKPQPIATLDLRIDYLRPATPKRDIFAAAEAYKVTRQVVFLRATAYQDGPDDLVAAAVGTFMLTGRLGLVPVAKASS